MEVTTRPLRHIDRRPGKEATLHPSVTSFPLFFSSSSYLSPRARWAEGDAEGAGYIGVVRGSAEAGVAEADLVVEVVVASGDSAAAEGSAAVAPGEDSDAFDSLSDS